MVFGLLAALWITSCTPPPPDGEAAGLVGSDHPLAGLIWSVPDQRFIREAELTDAMRGARYVLLGEAHDNPRHHALQAWALRALAEAGRAPAVPMEMIAEDQASGLKIFYDEPRTDAAMLPMLLRWAESGWPDWSLYAPVADNAVRYGMAIEWANFARADVRAMYERGWEALPPERRAALGLGSGLPDALRPAMEAEMADSHCGSLPADKVRRFAEIQYARDALMARRMMETATDHGAVLITGAGHARRDRGVPYHLARPGAQPGARGEIVSVGFVEVRPGALTPTDYDLPFDLVWFTPAVSRGDPCAVFESAG